MTIRFPSCFYILFITAWLSRAGEIASTNGAAAQSTIMDKTNVFIVEKNDIYLARGGIDPGVITEAQRTRECWPAKDFPEGNWGKPEDGVQVSLRFDKRSYTNREPIRAIVLVRNASNRVFVFYDSNDVGLGTVSYLAYTESNQYVASKPKYSGLRLYSGTINSVHPGMQRKFEDDFNRTYDLTSGNYLVEASIISHRAAGTNMVPYEIKSAKVPIGIK